VALRKAAANKMRVDLIVISSIPFCKRHQAPRGQRP
jgi:hypothetical protein